MSRLHEDLARLEREIATMGGLVEENLRKAALVISERRDDLKRGVVETDRGIDALENSIDIDCNSLLALQQPVADDLRLVLAVMVVNNELERIGDHAKNIAKAGAEMVRFDPLPVHEDLDSIARRAIHMVSETLDAFLHRDLERARKVREFDRGLDDACENTNASLIEHMRQGGQVVLPATQALRCVHNFERIGDLAGNIAKETIFLIEGKIVRHGGRRATEILGERA